MFWLVKFVCGFFAPDLQLGTRGVHRTIPKNQPVRDLGDQVPAVMDDGSRI
jgi:hypothetical protein